LANCFGILSFHAHLSEDFQSLNRSPYFHPLLIRSRERGQIKPIVPTNIIAGGIPTYFFAKGMFCGVALLLLGKILENQLGNKP
jgi:hypothetical protein